MYDYTEISNCLLADLPQNLNPFPTSDMEISAIRALSMKSSFLKKNVDIISQDADKNCLTLFQECNAKCSNFSLMPIKLFHDVFLGELKNILWNIFIDSSGQTVSLHDLCSEIIPGPGASLGARSYNFYTKLFDSPLTYTDERLPALYRWAIRHNPTWSRAEQLRDSRFGVRKVAGNRLSFVPKTSAISRSICTEPSLNMLFQKGLGTIIEGLLRRHFRIDLSTQPEINKNLARLGSIDSSFGTIDLKSASDSISLNLLKELLPPYIYEWLMLFRSPTVTYPDGSCSKLDMVSSMGNGFTFPLQTLLFASVVRACYRVLGIKPEYLNGRPSNFGVFGDDIIVRKDAYHFVIDCLGILGFTVNTEKSFNVGSFRESCGGDYYKGSNVRGVYCKTLNHVTDVYSTINRIVRWSTESGIPLYRLYSWLYARCRFLPVPPHAGDTEGIKVPLSFLEKTIRDANGSIYYSALVPLAVNFKAPSGETEKQRRYPGGKKVINFNPDGSIVSFVGGYIQDGRISLRSSDGPKVRRYKVRRRLTPNWDYVDTAEFRTRVYDWEVIHGLLYAFVLSQAPTK